MRANGVIGLAIAKLGTDVGQAQSGTGSVFFPDPFRYLPGALAQRWTSHLDAGGLRGDITLGAPAPQGAATVVPLAGTGPPGRDRNWDDAPVLCWRIDAVAPWCVPTVFDTGSDGMLAQGFPGALPTLSQGTTSLTATQAEAGLGIAGSLPGTSQSFFYTTTNFDSRALYLPQGPAEMVVGTGALDGHTLFYDLRRGVLSLSK